MSIIDNYNRIRKEIDQTAAGCGRDPLLVRIIAVSKTFPASAVNEALNHGISLFGENRVQEAREKIPLVLGNADFHLIGHLQSNKAKDAVKLFSMIHSIDTFETARKLDREAAAIGKVQEILIQVNTSAESTKSGCEPSDIIPIVEKISGLQNIRPSGLMTVGPLTDNKERIREAFICLRELRDTVKNRLGLELKELSMGMSGDYTIAVEEGATMVRIGSAIFGTRTYPE